VKKQSYYFINSVRKVINILELLARTEELSVPEIGKQMGMHRSATHRFLATLRELGYLDQSEDSSYRLSFKLFEFGTCVMNRLEVKKIVHPFSYRSGNSPRGDSESRHPGGSGHHPCRQSRKSSFNYVWTWPLDALYPAIAQQSER
jgi:hypothetical protein